MEQQYSPLGNKENFAENSGWKKKAKKQKTPNLDSQNIASLSLK